MNSYILKLTALALVFLTLNGGADAACPAFCYCNKAIAENICNIGVFSGCQVQACTSASCGKSGYKCGEKPATPSPTPSVTPLPSPPFIVKKPTSIISKAKKVSIQQKIAAKGGCKANVCFAIDGSGSIGAPSFQNEKDFVTDVASIIALFSPRVAATQYNGANHPITALTTDVNHMISSVTSTKQKSGSTSISAGIDYCGAQLKRVAGQANKVVVLGDGVHNSGGSAEAAANKIWLAGGAVSVVAAGANINHPGLLALTGNNPNLKFAVKNFNDRFALIQVIEQLTIAICG